MTKRFVHRATFALGLGLAAPALANGFFDPVEQERLEVEALGGAGTALGEISDNLGLGPVWGVNASTKIAEGVGFEGGYVGSRLPFTDNRVPDGSALWRNGVNGLAKLYVPTETVLQPYGGVGVGVSYLDPSDEAEPLYQTDLVGEVPITAGLDLVGQSITAGARLGYTVLFGEQFADPSTAEESPGGGVFSGSIQLGGRF